GSEHDLVRLAPDEKCIDGFHELRTNLGDFVAPVKPIVSTVFAGDVVVEAVGETERYFAHASFSSTIQETSDSRRLNNTLRSVRSEMFIAPSHPLISTSSFRSEM